jgi:hypothetical protein
MAVMPARDRLDWLAGRACPRLENDPSSSEIEGNAMRKTRWSWYLLLSGIAVVSAEGLSASTPIIYPVGLFVLAIYALHYVLILDFLAARNALTWRTLATGGLVLGFTTESLLTKVIWRPPWAEADHLSLVGLGVFEVGFVVMVWHAWMSLAIPVALTLTVFGYARLVPARNLRRLLLALPCTLIFVASAGGVHPAMAVPIVIVNGAGIMLSAWWFRRAQRRHPLTGIHQMRLTRGERRVVWALTLLLYAVWAPHRTSAIGSPGAFVLGMLLVAGSFVLLAAVRRADAGCTPPPGPDRYRHQAFARYLAYATVAGLVAAGIGFATQPVSMVIASVGSLVLAAWALRHWLILARQTVPPLWRRDRQDQVPAAAAGGDSAASPAVRRLPWLSLPSRTRTGTRTGTRRAIFSLMILAPITAELMSGSQPPLEFINPVAMVINLMLYGSGAVLIREFVRRWGRGWSSVLLLGLAYGIYEEGIVVRSFFDPTWQDLGDLAWYGRWLGVNWVWTIGLTLFHAVVSIAIPISLVELMYPDLRARPWVTRRGLKFHGLMFATMAPLGVASGMHAPPLAFVGGLAAMALLIWRAYRWRDPAPIPAETVRLPRQWRIALLGFASTVAFAVLLWGGPENDIPASTAVLLTLVLAEALYRLARRMQAPAWDDRRRWALAAGVMSVWIVVALLAVAGPDMPVAGVLYAVLLWRVRRRIHRREAPLPRPVQLAPPSDLPAGA